MRRQLQANPRPQRPLRLLLQVRRCKGSQEAVLKAAEGLRAALERPAKVRSTPPCTVRKGGNTGTQHGQHGSVGGGAEPGWGVGWW